MSYSTFGFSDWKSQGSGRRERGVRSPGLDDEDTSSDPDDPEESSYEGNDPQDVKIRRSNWGYQALIRMGWDGVSGLGIRNQGRSTPSVRYVRYSLTMYKGGLTRLG